MLHHLSESVAAFVDDLQRDKLLDRVLLMTFSEFGRTVAENGRRGTDHGVAAPMFLGRRPAQGRVDRLPSAARRNSARRGLAVPHRFPPGLRHGVGPMAGNRQPGRAGRGLRSPGDTAGIGRHAVTRYGYTRYIVPCVGMPTLCCVLGDPGSHHVVAFGSLSGRWRMRAGQWRSRFAKSPAIALVGQVPNCT